MGGQADLHALTTTNQVVRRWPGVPSAGALLEFAQSGELFAVVTGSGRQGRFAEIIDLKTSAIKARVPAPGVTMLLFDPTGTHLALAGAELALWRVADTNKLWSATLSHEASALGWSPKGNRLAVALDRRRPITQEKLLKTCPVIIFDAASGREESVFGEFNSRVARMAFHPAGDWLAVATWDSGLFLGSTEWDSALLSSEGAHRALRFSVDGTRLGCAPTREELGVLELAAPSAFRAWPSGAGTEEAFTMSVSDDDQWVATASGASVHLWDATVRVKVDSRPLPAKSWWVEVMFGPANECVYYSAASFGVRRLTLTSSLNGRLRFGDEQVIGQPGSFMTVGFSHDGRSLLVGEHGERARAEGGAPTMWLWPDAEPKRARKVAEDFPLTGYRVVPRSRFGVTTSIVQPDVWIWDFETGERLRSLGLSGRASSEPVANGRWLVARTRDEFGVWDVGTWKRISQWSARPDETSMDLFSSPDGRWLATRTGAGRFVLRELPSGEELILLTPPHSISLQYHQFSSDGTRLLVMGNNGQMFDWDIREIRRELAKLGLDWSDRVER